MTRSKGVRRLTAAERALLSDAVLEASRRLADKAEQFINDDARREYQQAAKAARRLHDELFSAKGVDVIR